MFESLWFLDSLTQEAEKIGGGIAAGVLGVLWLKLKSAILDFLPAKAEFLAINGSDLSFRARDAHEIYEHALGIHIHHQGGPNCDIVSAAFQPLRRFWATSKWPSLSIYPGSFRSRRHRAAFELKFGEQWNDPDLLLRSGDRILTYVPLNAAVSARLLSNRACGTVIIEYATSTRAGTHRSRIGSAPAPAGYTP